MSGGRVTKRSTSARAGTLRRRFRVWWQARLARTDTLLLTQRNVYILPTRAGFVYAATLLVLLIASINYQLNLGYLLTFLLAGSGVVSMHLTHAQLRGLTLHLKPVAPAFAGDPLVLDVVMTSPGAARFGIGCRLADAAAAPRVWTDVPALGQGLAQPSFVAEARGIRPVPALGIDTRFPLGLFRAWSAWRPAAEVLVYPRPEHPPAPLPPAATAPGGPSLARSAEGSEVEGVRAYRRGDPLKLIAWKKAAKALETGGELVSRDTRSAAQHEWWLEWQACGNLAPEERLSRLAAWVLVAERTGVEFGLRLPGVEIVPADGEVQRRRCLEALATWRAPR